MGKISNVYLAVVDPNDCSVEKAGEYYYLYNLLGTHEMFEDEYEMHEAEQLKLKNQIIKAAIDSGELPSRPNLNTTMLGISSIHDREVLVVEY